MRKPGKHPRIPRWRGVELPALDESRCTGCGICPEVCPTHCLAMGPRFPWLPRPGDCVSCGLCALVCPAAALHLEAMETLS
jgi:formate hydrogenlyase subunit 6/NADH:ubiquinone oxidoreductase subunit I